MKVLITGSNGFIGRNLSLWLKSSGHTVIGFDAADNEATLVNALKEVDFIVHLAGINRPLNKQEFYDGNTNFTKKLVDLIKQSNRKIPLIYSSSIQAELDNDYGKSKKMAEDYLLSFQKESKNLVYVYRLSNVFGKWCRPNYNSALATFCYNIANDLPIEVRDPNYVVHYVYIDDICKEWLFLIEGKITKDSRVLQEVLPIYDVSLGMLSDMLNAFKNSRTNMNAPSTKNEFEKKLYATYLSYLPENNFSYPLNMHVDSRGSFTEFLRTPENGQVSVNIANPGITKGNHYHHTKNEKFLTVSGECLIRFRKVDSKEVIEYKVSGEKLEVIDIPPGYTHSITNIGKTNSVTIMWSNEQFDPNNPDTYFEEV